jgi:hypothetical protein
MSFFPATAPIGNSFKVAKAGKLAKIAANAGKIGKIAMKVKKIAGTKVGQFALNNIVKPVVNNAVSKISNGSQPLMIYNHLKLPSQQMLCQMQLQHLHN